MLSIIFGNAHTRTSPNTQEIEKKNVINLIGIHICINKAQKRRTKKIYELFMCLLLNLAVNRLTWSALNCNFSSSIDILPKLVLVPLAIVPLTPKLLLLLLAPAVFVPPLLLVPPKPACETPSGFADGPLHDANKLNKCRFNSFDSSVVRLSTTYQSYRERKRKKWSKNEREKNTTCVRN